MNNSGTAVKELINYFKIDAKNVIVFHDDLDRLGKVKAKIGGGSAGHNGIESIDKHIVRLLKSEDRNRSSERQKVTKHVLEDFKDDEDKLKKLLKISK